jgi:hexosaminidase
MVPRPANVTVRNGELTLDESTTLSSPPTLKGVSNWFRGTVGTATGCWLPPGDGGVVLDIDPAMPAEGYRIAVEPSSLLVTGGAAAGVFYGLQTVRQLLPSTVFRAARIQSGPWTLPAMSIADAPQFGWRGVLLDVARHFLPKSDLLRFLELMAMHKLNVLHLHLTDDQGWRLEVRSWPRLTEVGSWRRESMVGTPRDATFDARPHGGFYTQDDIREIVAYAAERHIAVVPEIGMPSHMQAALAAYPELGSMPQTHAVRTAWGASPHVLGVSDRALAFCRDVLDEVCELFPAKLVCIGGDECSPDEWRHSAEAKARVAAECLASVDELQAWFTRRIADHLRAKGRRIIGWDEIIQGAPDDAMIAAWRGNEATIAAARAGHGVIVCPWSATYLDSRQSDQPDEPVSADYRVTLEGVYAFEPVPTELSAADSARVVGVQANIWTEHMNSARIVDYMAFPRLCAFAEVAWSGPGHDLSDFHRRLEIHEGRLRACGVEYRRATGPLPWQARPG